MIDIPAAQLQVVQGEPTALAQTVEHLASSSSPAAPRSHRSAIADALRSINAIQTTAATSTAQVAQPNPSRATARTSGENAASTFTTAR